MGVDDAPSRPGRIPGTAYWLTVLGSAAGLRLLSSFVVFGSIGFGSDASDYSRQATQMLADWGSLDAFFRPPGTSYALVPSYWLFGTSEAVTHLTMIGFSMASVVLVVMLASLLPVSRRGVELTGWIAALYPVAVFLAGQPLTHVVLTPVLLGFASCLVLAVDRASPTWFGASGLLLGAAVLIRADSAPVALVAAAYAVVVTRRADGHVGRVVGGVAVMAAGAVLVVAPTVVHNHTRGAGLTISTNDSLTLFYGNNPHTPLYWTSHFASTGSGRLEPETAEYLSTRRDLSRDELRQEALTYMRENPGVTALRTANRARALWGFDHSWSATLRQQWELSRAESALPLLFEAGGYFVVAALALVGFTAPWRIQMTHRTLLPLLMVVALALAPVLVFSAGIWHYSSVFLLMPAAGAGLAGWGERGLREGTRELVRSAWSCAAVAVLLVVQIEYGYWLLRYL